MTATKGRPAVWQAKKTLRRRVWEKRTAYIMIAPFTLIFLTFTLVPVVIAMFFSFTYYNILQPPQWVGWVNYVKLFFNDEIFLTAVKNTLIFAAVTGPVSYGLCFIVAWFVNELTPRVRALMTLLFYAPSLSGTVSIYMDDRLQRRQLWLCQRHRYAARAYQHAQAMVFRSGPDEDRHHRRCPLV